MKRYTVYNATKEILRTGGCSDGDFFKQARNSEFVVEGIANDITQKVEFDGLDEKGQPINPRVVDKTPEEIEADNPTPPEISFEKLPAQITNEQWQDVLKRLDKLETRSTKNDE